jgi:hypothetical protein
MPAEQYEQIAETGESGLPQVTWPQSKSGLGSSFAPINLVPQRQQFTIEIAAQAKKPIEAERVFQWPSI